MRLSANGFQAWVSIAGEEAEKYNTEDTYHPSGQTCWIASEANKGFSIHWRHNGASGGTCTRVWVDGIECAGEILQGPNCTGGIPGRRTSGSTVTPFVFSNLNITDDDAFLDSSIAHRDIGLIKVEMWTVKMMGTKPYSDVAPVQESKVHERSKKGIAHQTKFGKAVVTTPRAAAVFEYLEDSPRATFTFKYRSLDLLQANEIAQATSKTASAKRKAQSPSLAKTERKPPKRVKTEHPRFKSGEVIDLTTGSDTPQIIDLT